MQAFEKCIGCRRINAINWNLETAFPTFPNIFNINKTYASNVSSLLKVGVGRGGGNSVQIFTTPLSFNIALKSGIYVTNCKLAAIVKSVYKHTYR